MMRVVAVGESPDQLAEIRAWRKKHCSGGARPFLREYRAAVARLRRQPYAGHPYLDPKAPPGTLRLLLPASQYHLYYVVDEAQRLIFIDAVWHTSRETGPY